MTADGREAAEADGRYNSDKWRIRITENKTEKIKEIK
jgi:hypothetical protein